MVRTWLGLQWYHWLFVAAWAASNVVVENVRDPARAVLVFVGSFALAVIVIWAVRKGLRYLWGYSES